MFKPGWESNEVTESLRKRINDYVEIILSGELPRIPFDGYANFRDYGSRKESEEAYFQVRKQLTALGLYLQWNKPSKKEQTYFNELLWSVANEFTWCLAAHLPYGDQDFAQEPHKVLDLFAAETAQTLSELLTLHDGIIDPYIRTHIKKQIEERIFIPFLNNNWWWEASNSNWCAVCAGSIGMAALCLEKNGDRQRSILTKVDQALRYYLQGFGEDGATEEGIGYWVYGFGYYIYYTAMRREMDPDFRLSKDLQQKIERIARFPHLVQIGENAFLPFSDVSPGTVIPTGLASYLYQEFEATPPVCTEITAFDFDHCYRFAHISRNLWWTDRNVLRESNTDLAHYFEDRQWLVQRKGPYFFAVKGGHNKEEHNHNDVGSFVLMLHGEEYLTDLGAGPYTADYFGERRYEYVHTRSYYHNVPVIDHLEQVPNQEQSKVEEVYADENTAEITMELAQLYENPRLKSLRRSIRTSMAERRILLEDSFLATEKLAFEESFISRLKPYKLAEGVIEFRGEKGSLSMHYDMAHMDCSIEEKEITNHQNEKEIIYRLGLHLKEKMDQGNLLFELRFSSE